MNDLRRLVACVYSVLLVMSAVGCPAPPVEVASEDVSRAYSQHSDALSRLVAMLADDKQVLYIASDGSVREAVSPERQAQYAQLVREMDLPIYSIACDRSDLQLTVNVLVNGWKNYRLVYATGEAPKEPILACEDCPIHSYEMISPGWYVGIMEDIAPGE